MQEYWVNVYGAGRFGIECITKAEAIKAGTPSIKGGIKPIYRIHVKMKPPKYVQIDKDLIVERKTGRYVQLSGRFQRPCPLPKYERGPAGGWMDF